MSNPSKTTRVRVCIAIAEDGKWACGGWRMGEGAQSDADLRDCAVSGLDEEEGHYAVHWLEAEVPVPQRPAEMTIPALVLPEATEDDSEDEAKKGTP